MAENPSTLSKVGAVCSVIALLISVGYVVFVAGGQSAAIARNEKEIEALKQLAVPKSDAQRIEIKIDRLEAKIDRIIEKEK